MLRNISKRCFFFFVFSLILMIYVGILSENVFAADEHFDITGKYYENKHEFNMNSEYQIISPSYGKPIGNLFLSCESGHEANIKGIKAYAANGQVSFGYSYNYKDYQSSVKEKWNLKDSDTKKIGDLKLSKKVAKGTMIIQKSDDGKEWIDAIKPVNNLFSNKKLDLNTVYILTPDDIKSGKYYKIVVIYELKRKTGTKSGFLGIKSDVYDVKFCAEEYVIYVCYGKNPITIFSLGERKNLGNNAEAKDGFSIDCNGANVILELKKDDGKYIPARAFESYYEPGDYAIRAKSPIGDVFNSVVHIANGLSTLEVEGLRYENSGKNGYNADNLIGGGYTLSSLILAQKYGTTIKKSSINGVKGYGITGDSIDVFLDVLDSEEYARSGWRVIPDTWGKNKKETIDNNETGPIKSGAIVVQKSKDGKNWTNTDKGRYANGLHTTDYYENYGGKGDILIYKPDGNEVLKGLYLRVLYAYEIQKIDGKEKKRCLEKYEFYLCNDELEAVAFHNITAQKMFSEICGEDNEIEYDMHKGTETLTNGTMTVSGFSIDTSLNPTVTYTVSKDGEDVSSWSQFTETGKYDIRLENPIGTTKNVTLYVDRMDTDDTLQEYFGTGFIDGKRIFDDTVKYPVFEGGETRYKFESVSDNILPLYGTITNLTTRKSKTINADRTSRSEVITEAGEYEVVLNTNPSYALSAPSGDNKEITFHFYIIEQGTAPGPKVNQLNLNASIKKSIAGTYPKYYGLTYSSAERGYITRAFRNRESAYKDAYNYEKGTVEKQSDGSYLYIGSFNVKQKKLYETNWELTEVVQNFANLAIEELYFDVSDESKYRTLKDNVMESVDNLRTLELSESVIIYADGEEEQLKDIDALPILNSIPYAYLEPGRDGRSESGYSSFAFVRDKYGCDSNKVYIIDCNGKRIDISYGIGVDNQLKEAHCATGKVSVTEETIYGDSTTYDAIYFADGDNTAEVTLSLYKNDVEEELHLNQNNNANTISTNAFSIKEIVDPLDPYDLVIIRGEDGEETSYVSDQIMGKIWSDPGVYSIKVVNRIGNKYTFNIKIDKPEYATIFFEGEGTEAFECILEKVGNKNVKLPIPKRNGYVFAGYRDEDGEVYQDVIEQITVGGSKKLSPLWNPMKIKISLMRNDLVLETLDVDYGSEVELPVIETQDGYVIKEWSYNENIVSDNKLKINSGEDITLVASKEELLSDSISDDIEEEKTQDTEQDSSILSWVMILVVIVGISLCIKSKRKREKK